VFFFSSIIQELIKVKSQIHVLPVYISLLLIKRYNMYKVLACSMLSFFIK